MNRSTCITKLGKLNNFYFHFSQKISFQYFSKQTHNLCQYDIDNINSIFNIWSVPASLLMWDTKKLLLVITRFVIQPQHNTK